MDEKIRKAYEQMEPTPEQEERMLAALQKAQAEAAVKTEAHARPSEKRKGFRAWKVIAPIAACLVVGAIAVGVNATGVVSAGSAPSKSQAATSAVEKQDITLAQSYSVAASAYEDEATAVKPNGQSGNSPDGISAAKAVADSNDDSEDYFYAPNTEEYADVDENGFTVTAANPLSTVSADVDTASYANLRRMIDDGYSLDDIPDGAARVEEMLNYFTYDYAKPTGDDLFAMQAQASTCPWNPDTQLLTIGFATPYETGAADKGANLVFLIDVSGSMDDPDKLELLQDSFATLLESLDGNDRVSIVTYASSEEVVLDGASGDDDQEILRAIYRLRADGSTNGEAGLQMAYEVAERNFIDGGVNRIVMASDGDLNVGITSEEELYSFVDGKRETGVYLSVLGFGAGNYKDTKMETLADHGNGSYHYIDCIEEAQHVLSERLMANLVPFADDVKVQVEFNPSQVKGYRLIGYENRVLPDEVFLDDAADAGDVGPNAQFTVAYEIIPADSAYGLDVPDLKYGTTSAGDSDDWLTCSLRYRAFSDDAVHEQQLAVSEADATEHPSDDWKFASAVIEFGMVTSGSAYRGETTCDTVLETLDALPLDAERESFRALVEKLKAQTEISNAASETE